MPHHNIRFSSPPYRSRLALRQAETVVPLKYKRVLSIRIHSPTRKDSCSTILANDLTLQGTSMEDSKREVNIDSLRRDATDGSYHCPQCNAPFTRRSNLRRHYHIHKRNMSFQCANCNASFPSNDVLQSHVVHCPPTPTWDPAADPLFQAMSSFTPHSLEPTGNGNLGILGSNSTSDADFTDFLSSLSSEVPQQFDGSFQYGFSPEPTKMSPSPARTCSPSSASSSSASSSSFIASPDFTDPRLYKSGSSQSLFSSQPSPTFQTVDPTSLWNSRGNSLDRPIYTSQQVGDMLDAVSSCLIGTIDTVMRTCPHPDGGFNTSSLLPAPGAYSRNPDLKRMILNEALPRLIAGLDDTRAPSDPVGFNHNIHPHCSLPAR